ncbi:endonuclease [Psychroflexus aestuariivivens]|uniref:endonuclease n=1 Tax=Psychroflexus aestuariivivens TaxID=1795040 RepID=UPI000FDBBD91|nr:endonuclease [Psychroflexus aestuariivivens]
MNKITLLGILLIFQISIGQNVIINEVDSNTPGVDTQEFIELKTPTPNTSMQGHVLVLFNGSSAGGNSSYFALDLSSFTTDFNGLFVLGGPELSPSPNFSLPQNFIQNGADAVAVYQGSESDFPEGTVATDNNLVDALVYGTSDPDATGLLNLLNETEQIDENANGNDDNESIQRNNDGTWFVDLPTPRVPNDGGGETPIFIDVVTGGETVEEGEDYIITFSTSETLTEDLDINFTLTNGNFDTDDFTGNTNLTIPSGENLITTTISIVDDSDDEGDEVMLIDIDELSDPYILNSNDIEIIVIDNDFVVAAWGPPTNPTYDEVTSTQPGGYYDSLDGLSGDALRQAIQDIIAEEGVVRIHTYSDIVNILEDADESPLNSNEIWLVYSEESRPKYLYQTGSTGTGFWNREHVYPRSRGGFFSIEEDGEATGIDNWWNTNADSTRHANSDAHGLRAADANENSSRGNKHFGDYVGPDGNEGSFRGDVARAVFYLAVRYNELSVVDGFPDMEGQLGDLATLLNWHSIDLADDYEMRRNNIVYEWQNNRNPFIDFPELVSYIWGDNAGEVWNQPMSVEKETFDNIALYPNPAKDFIKIKGLKVESDIEIYSVTGRQVFSKTVSPQEQINLDLNTGLYLVKITTDNKSTTKKMIIK